MRLIRADSDKWVFRIAAKERRLLFELLGHYPLVPAASERNRIWSKQDSKAEPQIMLDEALAAQRKENREQVEAMLNESGRFVERGPSYQFTLSAAEIEWLLQVLNDIRVGSWIALGSPDTERGDKIRLGSENTTNVWLMETAGYFQTDLLRAFGEPT